MRGRANGPLARSWVCVALLAAAVCPAAGCEAPVAPVPCAPTPIIQEDTPCGPCGLDRISCVDGEWGCDGATECGLGDACASDADCTVGRCYVGRCAPAGMAFVQAGTFIMGSPPTERGRLPEEREHPVRLTRHFFIDATEVRRVDFEALMGIDPSRLTGCAADCPVEHVSWAEALAYANARSEAEGLASCYDLSSCSGSVGVNFRCVPPIEVNLDCTGYRLPTEAEWEYAYRAGTTTAYYTGDTDSVHACEQPVLYEAARFCANCEVSWSPSYDCSSGGARALPEACGPAPVGEMIPNAWGIHDMAGNVSEVVWDAPGAYPDFAEDPTGAAEEGSVVVRGSGFCGHMARLRAADRKVVLWHTRAVDQGFRLVRTYRTARPDERLNDHLCDNGCGGCQPLVPRLSTPCGPCGAGRFVCDGHGHEASTRCDPGPTDCRYGLPCSTDAECDGGGWCTNGHCAPVGFAHVPAGQFVMGSPPSEALRRDDEREHEVVIQRPFLLQQREVTQTEWTNLMGTSQARFRACGGSCPVESVSRADALAFANARSRAEGLTECYDLRPCSGTPAVDFECPPGMTFDLDCDGYRLPTEAEWEYAARAGAQTAFPNTDPPSATLCIQPEIDDRARYCGNCDVEYEGEPCTRHEERNCGPSPAGSLVPNPWGIHDTIGNIAELVWDVYDEYASQVADPTGPVDIGQNAITRGGGYCGDLRHIRAASRGSIGRSERRLDVGFRLARTIGPPNVMLCDNACGGCTTLWPEPGAPCGPCLDGRTVCVSPEAVACEGASAGPCSLGAPCTRDEDCPSGRCTNGGCAASGWRYIPPGTFLMGSPPTERFRRDDEDQHEVTLTRGFLMMEAELSQRSWLGLMSSNPARFRECGLGCPAESISWLDALAVANAMSRRDGLDECYDLSECTGVPAGRFRCPLDLTFSADCTGYRLPTEAEWEYAYRANTTSPYYVGEPTGTHGCDQPILFDHAQFCGNCAVEYANGIDCTSAGGFANCGTRAIASGLPNAFGLYDMAGNVAEWVWDVHADYGADPATDPVGPPHDGQWNVARGFGFCGHAARLRAADRWPRPRTSQEPSLGVRLVRTVP